MKLLLIHPWQTRSTPERTLSAEPLGLLSIATVCRPHAAVLDAHHWGHPHTTKTARGYRSGMTDTQVETELEHLRPAIVGISNNFTFGTGDALEVARVVRRVLPKALIVFGGAHATIDSDRLIQRDEVDVVVIGEGEFAMREIITRDAAAMRRGMPAKYKAPPIDDLDSLPIPDRSLIPFREYLAQDLYFCTRQKPVATVHTSRGCPFRCIFCSTQKVWGNHWRGRSAAKIYEELQYLSDSYGVREFAFQDDQFLGRPQRIAELCKMVIERRPGWTFIAPPGMSPAMMSPELLELMRDAGFYRICFSVDVGTARTQKLVKKPVDLGRTKSLVRQANRLGLWTYATFVIGFPWETATDIRETVRYAYKLGVDFLRFYLAQPHLGSELAEYYRDKVPEGALDEAHDPAKAFCGTDHLTVGTLERLRDEAVQRFRAGACARSCFGRGGRATGRNH